MLYKKRRIKSESNRAKRRELERSIEKKSEELDNIPPSKLLYKIKYELPATQSEYLLSTLSETQFNHIIGDLLPLTYDKIGDKSIIYSKNEFNKELLWYKKILAGYSGKINEFIQAEQKFDSAFLQGRYGDCESILSKIEIEICVSHWSIEKRLLLAEYQYGFKKNKETLTGILSKNVHLITRIFSKYLSIKVERSQSFVKYEEIANNYLQGFEDERIREYLQYKLNSYSKSFYQFKGFILAAESSTSIVDMYLSFINMATMTAAQTQINTDEQKTLAEVTEVLYALIDDNRLYIVSHLLGGRLEAKVKSPHSLYLKILNIYTVGNYGQAKKQCEHYFQADVNCFELFVIYIKCCIRLGVSPEKIMAADALGYRTLIDINNVFLKNEETQASLTNLQKTFNVLGRTPWTFKAWTFFLNQHSVVDEYVNIIKMSHVYSFTLNPALSIFTSNYIAAENYLDTIADNTAGSDIISFWKNICLQLGSINLPDFPNYADAFRKRIYAPQILQIKQDFIGALAGFKDLYEDNEFSSEWSYIFNQEEVIYGMVYCHIPMGNWHGAMELITDANLECPNIAIRLRNDFLIGKIRLTEDDALIRDISTPIFLHQYQKYITPNDLWIAYDNFLNAHGLNFPSEIELIKDEFNKEKLIYFLKYICRPEVYDSSYLFESQEHLENERVEVCLLLSKLDEENFEDYFNEISEISRNQLIRQGIKQIDESKIYVDVQGIRKAIDKDLLEGFNRLMNLLSLPISQIDKLDTSNDDYLISYYDRSSEASKIATSKIKMITTYSRFGQCVELFFKVRDMFIASNEFGIDTYLSMRIRHGTLLGEIRSVFEDYQLITKKDESSEKYQENRFWIEKMSFRTQEEKSAFDLILAGFSEQIDNISNELKNDQLQINTEKKQSAGLFDYSFFENELLPLLNWLGVVSDHSEFFDKSIELLWERTQLMLEIIREEISGPIKNNMLRLLSEMGENLEKRVNKQEHPELNDLIRNITLCKTEISNKLDKIAEWFNRTNNKVINDFYLPLPIDASVGTLKRVKEYSNFIPTIHNTCMMKFEGDTFAHFTYIMQNLLHNILKHAKLPIDQVNAEVFASEAYGELSLLVTNNFSDDIDLEELNQKISNTRQLLTQAHDNDRTRDEGGTGYLKIRKTIITDLKQESYQINISEVDERRIFKTEIKFNLLKLQKESNESIVN